MRTFIALISIIILLTASSPADQPVDPLIHLHRIHDMIDDPPEAMDWSVLIKEQIDPKDITKLLKKSKNESFVTSNQPGNEVQYTMDLSEKMGLSIKVTIKHYEQHEQASLVVEIKGTQWNEQIEQLYVDVVTDIQRTYFSRKARLFACLKMTYNATMYRNDLIDKIKHTLQLQHVSELMDPLIDPSDQQVWYGYTPQLTETINMMNDQTNVQIVVNSKEYDQFTVNIGTPILIHEY